MPHLDVMYRASLIHARFIFLLSGKVSDFGFSTNSWALSTWSANNWRRVLVCLSEHDLSQLIES